MDAGEEVLEEIPGRAPGVERGQAQRDVVDVGAVAATPTPLPANSDRRLKLACR